MKNIYELTPMRDARQSFYGKALVKENKKGKELYSYLTKVATIVNGKVKLFGKALCSLTTIRHVREFIYQETGEVLTMAQLRAL